METEKLIWCRTQGYFCEELIYLKCILYKLKNATRSYKFYKSIDYLVKLTVKYGLALGSNQKSADRVVRISPDQIDHIINATIFASKKIALELREGDGYMPVLLSAIAAVAVVKRKLEFASRDVSQVEQIEIQPKKKSVAKDEGEIVDSTKSIADAGDSESLFSQLMGKSGGQKRKNSTSESEGEEEVIVVVKRRK